MSDPDCVTDSVPKPTAGLAADSSTTTTTALADAGAAILRALAAPNVELRRRHIVTAHRLLTIAYGSDPGEADSTPSGPSASPDKPG